MDKYILIWSWHYWREEGQISALIMASSEAPPIEDMIARWCAETGIQDPYLEGIGGRIQGVGESNQQILDALRAAEDEESEYYTLEDFFARWLLEQDVGYIKIEYKSLRFDNWAH